MIQRIWRTTSIAALGINYATSLSACFAAWPSCPGVGV